MSCGRTCEPLRPSCEVRAHLAPGEVGGTPSPHLILRTHAIITSQPDRGARTLACSVPTLGDASAAAGKRVHTIVNAARKSAYATSAGDQNVKLFLRNP
jgi:hypothetical protein